MIGENGNQLGVMLLSQALKLAQEAGLDLVEVAAQASPPVCRIIGFGKFKYEQEKRDRESRKHQHANKLKEIKLRLNIDPHDYETKLNHVREFLGEGMKVKISLYFRGRENARPEFGTELMRRVIRDLEGAGRAEVPPRQMGRGMTMIIGPVRGGVKKTPGAHQDEPAEELEE